MTARFPRGRFATALVLGLLWSVIATAQTRPSTATGEDGRPLRIDGTVVLVEPDMELSLITAGGLLEPREAWSRDARRFYAEAVRAHLAAANATQAPDFDIPDELDPDSRLGQVVRLNEAVALYIMPRSMPSLDSKSPLRQRLKVRRGLQLAQSVSSLRQSRQNILWQAAKPMQSS